MKLKAAYTYLSLLLLQLIVLILAFPAFFSKRGNMFLCNWGDGVKNYFTLCSYVKEPLTPAGIFKYNSFAYPFGDYVYYTDNTPLFSIPFRWFCHHIFDASNYTIPAFNSFILLSILAATLLAYFILKAFLGKNIFAFVLALVFPWTSIQLQRIWLGDFNLSLSVFVLSAITLCIYWYSNRGKKLRQSLIAVAMVLLLVLAFLAHGYYIAIVSLFLGGALFFMGLASFRQAFGKLSLAASVLIPLIGFAAVMLLLAQTDKYLDLRQSNAMCYDCEVLKTHFLLLFTHYDFQHLGFPFASTMPIQGEMGVYLGNAGLFSFATIWTGCVFSTSFRKKVFGIQRVFFSDPLRKGLFLGGLISLAISFGEHYTTDRATLTIFTPIPWLNSLGATRLLLLLIVAALLIYGMLLLISEKARLKLRTIGREYAAHPYKKAFLLLCVAVTIYAFVGQFSVPLINIFNPLFYLHFITKKVEQFRCLSRFSWPFFWTFNIWIMYTVVLLLRHYSRKANAIVITLLVLVSVTDITDYVLKLRTSANFEDPFSTSALKKFASLHVDVGKYQAVLPVPYYVVGSEDYPHTIDDNADWSEYTMQLNLATGLPLMSCKMSRTPPQYSVALLQTVSGSTPPLVKQKLNDKPILVIFNRKLATDPSQITACALDRPESRAYYSKALEFVSRHQLQPIDSIGEVLFYEWQPQ